jgi:asparagine synthase (glutamine-hydrolysing)
LHDQVTATSVPALLHYEDRNSMAFSVEARVPFLDHRIVEFALSLPSSFKIRGSWTKWVLRKAASRVVPPRIAWRRSKMGYPTPMARWLRQDSDRHLTAEVLFDGRLAKRELVCPAAVREIWDRHQAGEDFSWLLYRVLTTELWFRHFIDEWNPCPVAGRARRSMRTASNRASSQRQSEKGSDPLPVRVHHF